MSVAKLFAIFVILQTSYKTAESVRCFECQDYPSPSLCTDVTTCTKDDFCYVEEYITTSGHVVYNSGCMTKSRCTNSGLVFGKRQTDLLVCSECCQGDMCNNAGCNKQAIPRDQRGPYCFTCDFMTDPEGCDKVTVCEKDEQCSLFIPKEFHMYPTLLYSAGCQSNDTCSTLAQTSTHAVCPPKCCTGDFCNTACGTPQASTTTVPTSTVATPSTTSPSPSNGSSSTPLTTPSNGGLSTQLPSNGSSNVVQTTTNPSPAIAQTGPSVSVSVSTSSPTTHSPNQMTTTSASSSTTAGAPLTTTVSVTTNGATNAPATNAPQWCDVDGYVTVQMAHSQGDLCIRVGQAELTWEEARARCKGQHADLLVLDNHEKIHAVREFLKNHHHVHADHAWIGAHNVNGHLEWVDGQQLVHWEGGDPHGGPGAHHAHVPHPDHGNDCVSMNKMEDYHWNNVKCDAPHTVFVCERTAASVSSALTVTPPQTLPPSTDGLQCADGGYHRVHLNHANDLCIRVGQLNDKTWEDARGICASQNASLLRLDTNEKIHAVREYMKNHHITHGGDKFWIGAFIPAGTNLLLWSDGSQVGPLDGVDPQHLSQGPEQHCVLIDKHNDFHWGSDTCGEHHRFICEKL